MYRRCFRSRLLLRIGGLIYLAIVLVTLSRHRFGNGEDEAAATDAAEDGARRHRFGNGEDKAAATAAAEDGARRHRFGNGEDEAAATAAAEDGARCQLVTPGPKNFSISDLLALWPADKPRGFVYATASPSMAIFLLPLIQDLYTKFNKKFGYPFIIFSESPDIVKTLRASINARRLSADQLGQVFAYDVSRYWEVPSFLLRRHGNSTAQFSDYARNSIYESGCQYPAGLGYWLMCRFQSKGLFEIPFVQGFEYALRLDSDSGICGELQFDIFAHMKEHDYWQGYLAEDTWDSCAERLTEAVQRYVQTYNVEPVQGNDYIKDARRWYIYNNFEIFKIEFYTSKNYRQYINFIESTGGFFYSRWGDAPVKTQASRLHMPKSKMREFKVGEVFYRHQSFERC